MIKKFSRFFDRHPVRALLLVTILTIGLTFLITVGIMEIFSIEKAENTDVIFRINGDAVRITGWGQVYFGTLALLVWTTGK